LDSPITINELNQAIKSQNNGKSAGTDQLIAEIFKQSTEIISPFFIKLYNQIFDSKDYPKSWGEGIIIPIFKGGEVDEAKNYRGITLINILSKIYSQILLNRLTKWSEIHDKISANQFGFQKGKSTTDCIFILHTIITKLMNENKKVYCAFLDFEKAFDNLDRHFLWQKLLAENVSTKFTEAIQAMYSVVKACVRHKSHTTPFFDSNKGIKQGDPSSSLMFIFFINDIIQSINSDHDGILTVNELRIFMILFADDGLIFCYKPETLQSMLKDIEQYCNTWGLRINTKKTKIMIFEKGRHTRYNFYLNGTLLELVNSFKYLGVYFFKNNNWHMTQKHLAQHAAYSLHNLFIIMNQIELTNKDKCHLFDSLVGSVLNYSAEVWGNHRASDIEKIHNKFCRKVLRVKNSTNLECLYGELGRIPYFIMRKIIMVKYWIRLLAMDDRSIPLYIYKMLKYDVDRNMSYNGTNWAHQIKSILDSIGMSDLWLHQYEIEINIAPIKQRIIDTYKQSWYTRINNSSRLDFYSSIKHDLKFETYLDNIQDQRYRIALTRLRVSSHKLAIETGRYINQARNERYCKQCNMNKTESEYHFLLVCPKYRHLRQTYFKRYYCNWPSIQKLNNLFSETSKRVVNKIAKYVYHAFAIRTEQ